MRKKMNLNDLANGCNITKSEKFKGEYFPYPLYAIYLSIYLVVCYVMQLIIIILHAIIYLFIYLF